MQVAQRPGRPICGECGGNLPGDDPGRRKPAPAGSHPVQYREVPVIPARCATGWRRHRRSRRRGRIPQHHQIAVLDVL